MKKNQVNGRLSSPCQEYEGSSYHQEEKRDYTSFPWRQQTTDLSLAESGQPSSTKQPSITKITYYQPSTSKSMYIQVPTKITSNYDQNLILVLLLSDWDENILPKKRKVLDEKKHQIRFVKPSRKWDLSKKADLIEKACENKWPKLLGKTIVLSDEEDFVQKGFNDHTEKAIESVAQKLIRKKTWFPLMKIDIQMEAVPLLESKHSCRT